MEDNEKKNENPEQIDHKAESAKVDSNVNEEQSDVGAVNNTTTDPNQIPANHEEQTPATNDDKHCLPATDDKSTENTTRNDGDQQQLPTSSTESRNSIDEKLIGESSPIQGESDLAIAVAIEENRSGESNTEKSNHDNKVNNDLTSSSVSVQSDCRTETKPNIKLDKSEIINELTTASIANCDSSEILDDSMNVINSNSSNNVSDSHSDNLDTSVQIELSCPTTENGAKATVIDESCDKKSDESERSSPSKHCLTSSEACSTDSASMVGSTDDVSHPHGDRLQDEPTSSGETAKIEPDSDDTPSVHSNVSDKGGGGTDNQNSIASAPAHQQAAEPVNKIVLNNSVDSISCSMAASNSTVVRTIDEVSELDACAKTTDTVSTNVQTDDKIGCDSKHSSIVDNPVAYCGSVIRPTNLSMSNFTETINQRDNIKSPHTSTVNHVARSESLPHIELPKTSSNVSIKRQPSIIASSNDVTLDLTQSHSLSERSKSLYVSNPDFTRPKPSTEDLSSLRMKPPDFSKITHAYSTNNLKIPNPNFNEMGTTLRQHQPEPSHRQNESDRPLRQPETAFKQHQPVNPANFAEISKRMNYISDLQLKTATPPSTHASSFDRPLDSSRNMSNLYVKAPDFSAQKKKIHETADEPIAHVIHKNPYTIQNDKSNKIIAPPTAAAAAPSDPSIIYRSYPQISQDVTMSIVQTQGVPHSQHHQQQHQNLSQKQNMVQLQSPNDQRFQQNYPADQHKGHPSMYRSTTPATSHHLYENRVHDVSHSSKTLNPSYKHKTEPYQRETNRAAVIQSGKSVTGELEEFNQRVPPTYNRPGYYEKPVGKPIVASQPPLDYMQAQQHYNSRYAHELNERNKLNYERPGYCEPNPGLYQEHYKQPPQSMKHSTSVQNPQTVAPPNRPLRSPVMNSKPIDIPSGGQMNPPQYWPSHSPRTSQSPISLSSSPLSGRVTQSPAGASPSPQHHIMYTPSALPAQSPTYRYASPNQTQPPTSYNVPTTASSPIQFKDAMYQKPSKSKSTKPSTKGSVSQQSGTPNYHYLPPETTHYPNHQYSIKVEQSAHYPPNQYSNKTDNNIREDARPKQNKPFPDYVDLAKPFKPSDIPSPHLPHLVVQQSRYDQRSYPSERQESYQHHRNDSTSNKHAQESSSAKHNVFNSQQKTIMDPYAYRKASEADLNYEIIKKTLNKDISIRRSDTDLSCSIFDTPKLNQSKNVAYPMPNDQCYGRGYPTSFNYPPQPVEPSVRRDPKPGPIVDGNRYYPGASQPAAKIYEAEQVSRPKLDSNSSRQPNDLKKHDLSVTVSRISAASSQPVEQARLQHSDTLIQPSTSRHQSTAQTAKARLLQPPPAVPQKPTSSTVKSVLTPVKRESPLDLSVKTVKTKADSTGDDYAVPSSSRDYNTPLSLKVDFSPNFQKHTRVSDKSTYNHIPPRYEHQMSNSQYPSLPVQRPTSEQPTSQSLPQKSNERLQDIRHQHHQPHLQGASTYGQYPAPTSVAPSTQIRSHQPPNESYKHQSKPLVLNPSVPTVFGRKPEELKNLPINPELQDCKSTPTALGSYENDNRLSKNQPFKSNYHNKPSEHLLNSHQKPHEASIKFSDFKTKSTQKAPIPNSSVESLKDCSTYPYGTVERSEYVAQYQDHRSMSVQSRIVEHTPAGHYDQHFSRKRQAEPPSHNQYPTEKQMRRDELPNQHFYNVDKRYPAAADSKGHEMSAEKMNYHPKFATANYQRTEPNYSSAEIIPSRIDTGPSEVINPAAVVRDNISSNYSKQHLYHYPEPMYNSMENKAPTHHPTMPYPTEQHQKHLAYQKSKKEVYQKVPSPQPAQPNYYARDNKHHPYENYNPEPYQPYKADSKQPYYNDASNRPYSKLDTNPPQQVYQQQWPQNHPTLQPDSSKQPYPSSDIRNREFNPTNYTPRSSADVTVRPNIRLNSTEQSSTRQPPTLKGADQTVISKLRTNLEMKEIEKQKLLRNQSSTETVDEENQKSDIASLIAARIRTKGELKGFTPIPAAVPEPKLDASNHCDAENKNENVVPSLASDMGGDSDNTNAFDLLDWGSTCNDFVEQLQGSGTKKRNRRRRGKSSLFDTDFEMVEQEVPPQNLPGVDYKCDIDENVVSDVKAETECHQKESPKKNEGSSSSDEDKPLLFLRQKSLNETRKMKATQSDDVVNDSSTVSETTKQEEKRTNVITKMSEKIAKNKKEQQREKRENEKRISIASSSESDGDASPKIKKRPKKTVRKPRTRSSVGYQNSSDDETSENDSKNSKRKNDHTKRKKSSKSSSDSEPLKHRKKSQRIDSDVKSDDDDAEEERNSGKFTVTAIKQEVISDEDESDCKMETMKTPVKKEPGVFNVKIEETMTRSKRKQELERQKANSKILRNDKMVRNVSVFERKSCDPKKGAAEKSSQKSKCKTLCKDDAKRKFDDVDSIGESSKNDNARKNVCRIASVQSISSDSDEDVGSSMRRRTRSAKSMDQRTPEKTSSTADKVVEKKWSRNSPQKKAVKEPVTKPLIEQFPPGWENEVYEFKRSLKIPASLITIKKPSWYRKSISLPDLDPHSSDTSETFSEKKQLFVKPFSELSDRKPAKKEPKQLRQTNSTSANVKTTAETVEKLPNVRSTSIIDRLHQKIIPPISRNSKKARLLHSNEPKLLPQSNAIELLPTPGSEDVFKHQSVFETAVLNSRTRKEYRTQKNQEIIREVFGCDDRPASAPPLHAVDNKVPAITFDQKYKQYLEKMNMDFDDSKQAKLEETTPDVSIVKQEKLDDDSLLNDDETQDTEINECERNALDIKDEPIDSNERDTPSVSEREGVTPSSLSLIRKRGRGARGGRRKGSSGFDYIRKKKKPPALSAEGGQQKRRSAAINYLQEKDENDINREIRGWVLNKGVGETVLHKAARLGYIDVIAFCLQRLEMNPDQKDNAGYTALHEACSRGHLDIARLLLEYGANHSETAVLGGIRPLHEAVENGYIEVVRLLLSYGADPLLATYSGQTPIMLAENDDPMIAFLKGYLHDIQNTGPNKIPWKFDGAWKEYDPDEYGYNMFDGVPIDETDAKTDKVAATVAIKIESNPTPPAVDASKQIKESKCDSNSNIMPAKSTTRKRLSNPIASPDNHRNIKSKYKNLSPCTVVLTNLTDKTNTKPNGAGKAATTAVPSISSNSPMPDSSGTSEQPEIIEFSDDDSDADFFEIEESQAPHVPLYHLRDEGAVKWALLSDLCYMLKVKSKDTLLKQICSSMPTSASSNKELLRELKMGDFLERATCLQLLSAGEKLNIRASKVVLVKYNDSVKNLLGVKTVLMKM